MPETQTRTDARNRTQPGEEPRTNIEVILKDLRRGRTLLDLQEQLQKVVAAVKSTGKKGELTLSLAIACRTPGNKREVEIDSKVKAKIPEAIRPTTIFFTTEQNTLQREDPRQGQLEGIIDD